MTDALVANWKLLSSEGFDEYMKEVGVSFLTRKVGNTMKPNVKFEVNGDEWSFITTSTLKTHVIKFKLNEEFDEETADGRKVRAIFTLVDGKLVQTEKDKDTNQEISTITREITPEGHLRVTARAGTVESVRVYEKDL